MHGDTALDGRFRNILCATDLSPDSRAVSDYALALARDHQAQFTLLHIPENIVARTQDKKALSTKAFRRRLEELAPDGVGDAATSRSQ